MQKPIVLAADDSVTVRKLIEISLPRADFQLDFAVDGQECLRKAAELQPDLILLDYILPDMKGVEVCQSLLNLSKTRNVPVLLISGNGAAIRQTYESLSNVADYLTKPFAPNVLAAVVTHQLSKRKAAATSAAAEPELNVASPGAPAEKPLDPSAELRAKIRASMRACLRRAFVSFPTLEAMRDGEPPEDYYWNHLEAAGGLGELEDALLTLADLRPPAILLRTASELCRTDDLLRHLQSTRASGSLTIELPDEKVLVQFENGEIVFITSNHPKRYCAGAQFNFRAVAPTAVAAAVTEQQQKSIPFFLGLLRAGALPQGSPLAAILRAQGEATLARAITSTQAAFTLEDRPLAADLAAFRLRFPLARLLLAAYRTIDDWLIIESAIPNFDLAFARNPEAAALARDLNLLPAESQLLSLVDGIRTVQELVNLSARPPYQVCRQLYPFVRLNFLTPATTPAQREAGTQFTARKDVSDPASAGADSTGI